MRITHQYNTCGGRLYVVCVCFFFPRRLWLLFNAYVDVEMCVDMSVYVCMHIGIGVNDEVDVGVNMYWVYMVMRMLM